MAIAAEPRPGRSAPVLLPAGFARAGGFLPLLCLGAYEWGRLSVQGSPARGLASVGVALGVAAALMACAWLPRRTGAVATWVAAFCGLVAAALASGVDPVLFKPARWEELLAGLARGLQQLAVVRLPYSGADPWPQQTLDLGGALICVLAGLLIAWPRASGRGFPFFAWGLLLLPVVLPVMLLGGSQPIVLGLVLAVLSVLCLWLERMPLRPGAGVLALSGIALAGALPFALLADRERPWFDYEGFAERLAPARAAHFSWEHDYGPLRWPREGRELLWVAAERPAYWKVETLDAFDGRRWRAGGAAQLEDMRPAADLAPDWEEHAEWTGSVRVTVRNLGSLAIAGPGTLLSVEAETRRVRPGFMAGSFVTASELRRGDSYRVRFHAPRPSRAQLARAGTAGLGARAKELMLEVPRAAAFPVRQRRRIPGAAAQDRLPDAAVAFPPFGSSAAPTAVFATLGRAGSGAAALRRSPYARTWALARRLRQGARTPLDYVLAVDRYLEQGFFYSERPPAPAAGRPPLEAFLFDSRVGYCQHFSGAMALLLRMGGIPARVATGFTPGGFRARQDEWVVRDTDAHSWVEAWFAGIGWATFDPTPADTPARSQIAAISTSGGDQADSLAGSDAAGADQPETGSVKPEDVSGSGAGKAAGDARGPSTWELAAAVAALLLAAAALWRRRRLAVMSPDTALERAVAELRVALRRSGHIATAGVTLAQLERRLRLDGDAADYLRSLRAGRYGRDRPPPTTAQRRALRRQLTQGLGLRGRLWGLWALPPWRGGGGHPRGRARR